MSMLLNPGRRSLAALLVVLAGCADTSTPTVDLPRKMVAGTVTLDGQPLAKGKVQFEPVKETKGPSTFAIGEIHDGKYSIETAAGPVPGHYRVIISSQPSIIIAPDELPGPRPKMEPEKVPPQYNIKSTLTKEVTTDSVNTIDFELKSQ